ncbi:MAG: DUF2804 domain-containing protein [Treponema sp.]|jgi:hypothetical protein|nr:DUF2804 domain-containing protein [Treponema sp.]
MSQTEINATSSVLDNYGWPRNFGWAKAPYFFYDPALVYAPHRRITEMDRYIVFSATHLVAFEIIDSGWLGYMGISVVSLKDKKRSTQVFLNAFPLGAFEMPPGSEMGSIRFRRKSDRLDFVSMGGGARIIKADVLRFGHHRSLRGELVLLAPDEAESLVTNLPWPREKDVFRYARSSPWYSAEGVIQFGTSELVFTQGNAWGIFEWSRAVRPRSDLRFYAAACGMVKGFRIGFSIGYDTSDSSRATENAFFVDGKIHKLDQVTFHISPGNWMDSWHFTSNDQRLTMTFHPHQEREDKNQLLLYSMRRRQFYGFFSGTVILDDGSGMDFKNLTGFAERKKTQF